MELLALVLAALAFLLAVPVPRLLYRARFGARSPWAAMLLWQAIALAGGLSLVGAPIIYGLAPFGNSLPVALSTAVRLTLTEDYVTLAELHVDPSHIFSLCLGLLLGGHLLLTLLRTYLRVLSARRRHRQMVELLSTPLRGGELPEIEDGMSEAQIIEHEAPMAYCLPGRTSSRSVTVLSRGLLNQLSKEELAAVVAHERTHLLQRHHLLTMAFDAWYRALPWLPTTRYGREAVMELTEMLADDGALGIHSREDLLRSLALSSPEPEGRHSTAEDATDRNPALITTARLQRLLIPPRPLSRPALAGVVTASTVLLGAPTVLLLVS